MARRATLATCRAGALAACEPAAPARAPLAAPARPDPALWSEPLADAELERGRVVWTGTCIRCHSTGLAGAPLIGSRELWAPRIAQGTDVLFAHALGGFVSPKGNEMPARGGNPALSDDEVRAAVRFMVSKSR